ncbi:MAG TPA: hypothetical protein VNH42_02870 [Mariprofundaceae bacterium]|nr:hypothetical protein [Mariprofundaceae bacterium]
MGRAEKQRFYIHGDRHESDPDLYYCVACDMFLDQAHFAQYHVEANADLYHAAVNSIKELPGSSEHHRPENPENLFS